MPRAYYNEVNSYAAGWLRNLVSAGLIPDGDVDDRSIVDVTASDLTGYTQAHFFAGIGGWPWALRAAGWPDDRPIWTGSCPCQPFSTAGKGDGFADERHLWPAFFWLIEQCRPGRIAGEQVDSPDARLWFDLVSTDLEACGYACGSVVFPSAGIGAPNIRHRRFWLADAEIERLHGGERLGAETGGGAGLTERCGMGDAGGTRLSNAESCCIEGPRPRIEGRTTSQPGGPFDPWRKPEWVDCTDGRSRPFESGSFPLAARRPGDVGKLRAYGNAVNFEVTAEFVRSWPPCGGVTPI